MKEGGGVLFDLHKHYNCVGSSARNNRTARKNTFQQIILLKNNVQAFTLKAHYIRFIYAFMFIRIFI